MRVGMYYSNSDVRVEEAPVPKIGKGELLVKVRASGICGSDVMEWYRKDRVPLVLGHEIGGEIVEIGSDVVNVGARHAVHLQIGRRITAAHHVPCGECRFCKMGHPTVCDTLRKTNFSPGGFSEYIRIPAINIEKGGVFLLSDNVSYEEATFVEPLACVLRGQRLANMQKGKSVLVLGSGVSGLLHLKMARYNGVSLIIATDTEKYRLAAAKNCGADYAINAADYKPDDFRKANNGLLADLVIVCTGAAPAINQSLESVERGGTILFFAPMNDRAGFACPGQESRQAREPAPTMPFNRLFWRNEITLTSSYAASPAEHQQALDLITAGKITVADIITHRLPLEQIGEGFRLVAEAKESLKVIIEMQS